MCIRDRINTEPILFTDEEDQSIPADPDVYKRQPYEPANNLFDSLARSLAEFAQIYDPYDFADQYEDCLLYTSRCV